MQLGFILDQSRCIGCHACTVACKSENEVPLGDFRTWVKYTETGSFPEVRRSFTVLRCNQCTDAPCVTICPVTALDKRPDGIVDVDHRVCIGCKACMQGCPYDALYLNEHTGTAQKCHFCAHRTEIGLAPACAVVCPTEAIIPGDFHDPNSAVSRMRDEEQLTARKVEAGTGPNVLYKEAHPSGVDPQQTNTAGGFLWANQTPGIQLESQVFESFEEKAQSRTVYNVEHAPVWGGKVSAYLFTKSLAAGAFLAGGHLLAPFGGTPGLLGAQALWIPIIAIFFLLLTTVLLVGDLRRPERFLLILLRPNMKSWLAKGSYILIGYGGLLTAWLGAGLFIDKPLEEFARTTIGQALVGATILAAVLTACYTAWLFGQSKGRVLWMRRGLWLHLTLQAGVAGFALFLVLNLILDLPRAALSDIRLGLCMCLAGHFLLILLEGKLSPKNREREYARANRLVSHGPFSKKHWSLGVALGIVLPVAFVIIGGAPLSAVAGLLALIGLFVEEDILVRAGQALPIS